MPERARARTDFREALFKAYEAMAGVPLTPELRVLLEQISERPSPITPKRRRRFRIF